MRKSYVVAAILVVSGLSACSRDAGNSQNASNASENSSQNASNASATKAPPPDPAARFKAMSPPEQRAAYEEMAACAGLTEAMKLLSAELVQEEELGARRDRMVTDELGWRGRAGAMRARTSTPANVLGMSYAEVNEDVEERAQAVRGRRGSSSLLEFSDEIEREAEQCYDRFD